MGLNIYELHTDPSKLNHYESKTIQCYEMIKSYEVENLYRMPLYQQNKELCEKIISKSATDSYDYATHILYGRFERGEKAIATDAYSSFLYAVYILKGRFELGEKAIAKKAYLSVKYAKEVLYGRFELAEETINASEQYSKIYDQFLKTLDHK